MSTKTGRSTRIYVERDGFSFVILVAQDFLAVTGDYRWTDTGYGNASPCNDGWMDERIRSTGKKSSKRLRAALIDALRIAVDAHNVERSPAGAFIGWKS